MPLARIRDVCLLIGMALLGLGLFQSTIDWKPLIPRAIDSAVLAGVAAAAGLLLGRLTRRPAAGVAVAVVLSICALAFAGFPSVGATLLLGLGGLAVGTMLPRSAGLDPLVRWVAGMGLVAAFGGWSLPFPLHRGAAWALALGALALIRRRAIASDLTTIATHLGASFRAAPVASLAWAVIAVVAAAPAWLPMGNADDLAYHLNLGGEFLHYGYGRLDIGTQSWALAPWSTDILHAIVTVISGQEGAGPLNALWLVGAGLLVHSLGRTMGLAPGRAWLASMLYLSLPLTSFLAGSLQTEPPTTAALVAIALAIPGDPETRRARLPVIAALAGFCMGAKISNALLLAPFLAWIVISWFRAFPWRALAPSIALGVLAGSSSYFYGMLLTGNPVVPMFNAYFLTPWFPPTNFTDSTWQSGFGPQAFWRMVFDTPRYFEGYAGAAGVVLVALVGGIPAALVNRRVRPFLLVGLAAMLLVFFQVQYLRYLHPALGVLVPALVAALLPQAGRWTWREALMGLLVLLQVGLIPTSSWKFMGAALRTLAFEGPQGVSNQFVPERAIHQRQRMILLPTDRVLYVDPLRSHGSELPGASVGTAWFTPLVQRVAAEGGRTVQGWSQLVERAGVNYLMTYDLGAWPDVSAFLASRQAIRVDANGAAELYWLPPQVLDPKAITQSGSAGVDLDISVDRVYPVLGQGVVALRCSQPGKPIAVSWTLPASAVQPMGHWEWVTCGPAGTAAAAVQFRAGAKAGSLHFTAKPAQPDSTMTVTGVAAAEDVRRDFTAETALYRWVRRPFCGRQGCEADLPAVLPLTVGPITRFVEPLAMTGPPEAADTMGAGTVITPRAALEPVDAGAAR